MQPSRLELKCRTERTVKRRLSVVNLSLEDNLPFIYAEANCSSFVLSQSLVIVYPDPLTDKELHELIQSVDESGYFDKPSAQAEEEEEDLVGDVCVCGWGRVCVRCVGGGRRGKGVHL